MTLVKQQQMAVIMEAEPKMSIWKAAEQGDVAALTYFIQHHTNQQQTQQIQQIQQQSSQQEEEGEDEDDEEKEVEKAKENEDEENEDTQLVQLLNSRDPSTECTLVHLVVSNNPNPLKPLQLLLEHGADVTARNIYNVQAIHALFLRCTDPLEPLQLLIKYDADPNARDGDGWTPVHYAARFCKSPGPVLKYLVSVGADVNAIDASKKTPLFALLASGDHSMTLDWLINQAKANIKVKGDFLNNHTRRTKSGSLVLQAAKYGRLSSLRILISSASAMESLESILTKNELIEAIELIKQQLVLVKEQNDQNSYERLGLMILILENLIQKLYGKYKNGIQEEQITEDSIKRRPSLLKRMGNSFWRSSSSSSLSPTSPLQK